MQPNNNIESPNAVFNESEELKIIEEKLREKEKSLADSGEERPFSDEARRELLRDIIRERMQDAVSPAKQNVSLKQAPPFQSAKGQDWTSKSSSSSVKQREHEEKLRKLVVLAFEKNIPVAVEETLKMPAYYIDALHDALVDKFFSELSRLGKI